MTTRWRRFLIAITLAGAVSVAVVVGARAAAPRWIRGALERVAGRALGREVTMGGAFELSFSLTPSLTATDVTLANAAWGAEPAMVRVGRIQVAVDLVSLWSGPPTVRNLVVEDVTVLFETDAEGRHNWDLAMPPRGGAPAADVPLVIERALLRRFEVTYRKPGDARPQIVGIESLDAALDPATRLIDVKARGRLNESPWDVAGRLGTIERLYTGHDWDQALSGHIGRAALTLSGRIRDPLKLSGPNLELSIDGPDVVEALAVVGLRSPLTGPFRLHAVLATQADGVGIEVSGAAGGVTAAARGVVDALLDPARFDATVDVSGSHAAEVGSWTGVAGLPHLPFDLTGRVRRDGGRLSIDGLSVHVGGTSLVVAGSLGELPRCVGTDLKVAATGTDLAELSALTRVALPEDAFALTGRFLRRADGLAIEDVALEVHGAVIHASGTIGEPPRLDNLDLTVDGSGPDASFLSGLARLELPQEAFELAGRVARAGAALAVHDVLGRLGEDSFAASGQLVPVAALVGTDVELRVKGPDLQSMVSHAHLHGFPAQPYEAVGRIRVEGDHYALDDVDATVGGLTARLDGVVGWPSPNNGTSLLCRARGAALSKLGLWGVPVTLPPDPFAASGRLRIEDGVYSVDDLSAEVGADRLALEGTLGKFPDPAGLDVTVEASGPSLAALGRFAVAAGTELPARIPKEPYTVSGRLRRAPGGVELEKIKVGVGSAKLDATGVLSFEARSIGTDLTLDAEAPDTATLQAIVGAAFPAGALRVHGRVRRTADGFRLDGTEIALGPSFAELSGSIGEAPRFAGTDLDLRVEGPDLAALLAPWTGPLPVPNESFALSAGVTGSLENFSSDRFDARLGDSDLTGRVSLRLPGKPFVDADLRSKRLDVPGLIAGFTREPEAPGAAAPPARKPRDKRDRVIPDWPLALGALGAFDARLRLSADAVPLPGVPLRNVTIAGHLEDGAVTIDRAEGSGRHGGLVTASASLRPEGEGYRIGVKGRLDGGRLDLPKLGETSEPSPSLDIEYAVDGTGRSLHELAASADGQILVMLGSGSIPNTLTQFMTTDVIAALFDALNPYRKSSPFTALECGIAAAAIDDGAMVVQPIATRTDKMTVLGHGSLNLATERIDLSWTIKSRRGVGLSGGSIANPYIKLGGTLAHPALDVKPLQAVASTGAAVVTAGLTILFRGLYDRITAEKNVCVQALAKARKQLDERDARKSAASERAVAP